MTQEAERVSKIITERMGLCWHEDNASAFITGILVCNKCGEKKHILAARVWHIDWTSPEHLCELIRWAKKQEWWFDFMAFVNNNSLVDNRLRLHYQWFDQPQFAQKLSEWLGRKGN